MSVCVWKGVFLSSLELCLSFQSLNLSHNHLSVPLSNDCNATALTTLDLSYNQAPSPTLLQLTLPWPISQQTHRRHTCSYDRYVDIRVGIFLQNNGFTGAIPADIGQIVSLNTLDLSHNHLSGPTPLLL